MADGNTDRIDVEITLGKDKRIVDVLHVEVFVCDVVHSPIPDIGTGPRFESGSVLKKKVASNISYPKFILASTSPT